MPPAVTRELSITYAGFGVGGTSATYLLDASQGRYKQTRTYEKSTIEFTVLVQADSEANFATACAALEAAYRTPRGALQVALGSSFLLNLSHTANTGFNANPLATKSGGEADNARSRRYDVVIEFTEPADLSGQNGRRTSTVERSYDPARKATITMSGTYTALGGNSAQAQYDASISAFTSAVLSGFGGTYEKVSETTGRDDANKELSFRVVYEEVIYNQSSAGLDHAAIVQPHLVISFSKASPGDSQEGSAKRLSTVTASFDTWVDKTVSSDLKALYTGTIRPFLLAQADAVAGGGITAIVNEQYQLHHSDSRITAELTILSVGTSNTIEYELTTEVKEAFGRRIVPIWSGSPYAAHVMPNPGVRRRIVTERIVEFGDTRVLNARGPGPVDILGLAAQATKVHPPDQQHEGWITVDGSIKETTREVGDGRLFNMTERFTYYEQQWVESSTGFGSVAT